MFYRVAVFKQGTELQDCGLFEDEKDADLYMKIHDVEIDSDSEYFRKLEYYPKSTANVPSLVYVTINSFVAKDHEEVDRDFSIEKISTDSYLRVATKNRKVFTIFGDTALVHVLDDLSGSNVNIVFPYPLSYLTNGTTRQEKRKKLISIAKVLVHDYLNRSNKEEDYLFVENFKLPSKEQTT